MFFFASVMPTSCDEFVLNFMCHMLDGCFVTFYAVDALMLPGVYIVFMPLSIYNTCKCHLSSL